MLYFCTYFDSNYLARFLCMHKSLTVHCHDDFKLYALCLDDQALVALDAIKLEHVETVSLLDFERNDSELAIAKQNRSKIEYYFTCTSSLLLYLLREYDYISKITYLDADLFFYSSIKPIYDEMRDSSILIIPHRFPEAIKKLEVYGIYNVGLLVFCRDDQGLACLKWWREKCLEWCYDREEDGKFADQKYLDQWPMMFQQICILSHIGANLAPWNIDNYKITQRDNMVLVDGSPLIFYHFQAFRPLSRRFIDPGLISSAGKKINRDAVRNIHLPYVRAFLKQAEGVRTILSDLDERAGVCREMRDIREQYSLIYSIRMFLEARVVLCVAGRAWYCDSCFVRSVLRLYARVRG